MLKKNSFIVTGGRMEVGGRQESLRQTDSLRLCHTPPALSLCVCPCVCVYDFVCDSADVSYTIQNKFKACILIMLLY